MAAKQNLRVNQSGLAAITVTLIILGIVTLITVGFATLMRREQRQALDQQLSTQAFYAAESGVNSARDYIDSTPADDLEGIDDCNDPNTPNAITSEKTLSSTVSFSCVLMDVTPENLEKSTSTDESWVTKVESENGAPIHRLEISWQTSDSSPFAESALADTHLLWPAGAGGWDTRTAVLRMMVMPDTADRNTIIRSTYQAMLYPNASNNPNDVATATAPNAIGNINNDALQAVFINGNCNTAKEPYKLQSSPQSFGSSDLRLLFTPYANL
jgi:Tfp pilus assembly protein PilX